MSGTLYFGDNLSVLREHIRNETVDLIYLDPPFNSNATYAMLFRTAAGREDTASIKAFEDTFHWGHEAEAAFSDVIRSARYAEAGALLAAMRAILKEGDLMAYLAMMAVRLTELHRVLKPTGSLYLHCDPTASHYLKLMLDAIFGAENFRNEVIWKRTSSANNPQRWGPVHDVILFYSKSDKFTWNKTVVPLSKEHIAKKYTGKDAGGAFTTSDLTAAGVRTGDSGKPWRGFDPASIGRHWAVPKAAQAQASPSEATTTQKKLDLLDEGGFIHWPTPSANKVGWPRFRRHLGEGGQRIQDVIDDIPPINAMAAERLGYPTQKPIVLLERIIAASSKLGDVVLDPFCGCGTAVEAAHKLDRSWIGIDVTHLAIRLIEKRLRRAFPGITFTVSGTPKDLAGARDLAERDKHQFQLWAVSMVDAAPYQGGKKGADSGIDGWRYMASADRNQLIRCVVSVKGGANVNVAMVRDLGGVMDREKVDAGIFVTLAEPTKPMIEEAARKGFFESPFGNKRHPRLQILTIKQIMDGTVPDLPPLAIDVGFRQAEKVDTTIIRQNVLFPLAPAAIDQAPRQKRRGTYA
jgi:site-specific DNA-methyltransferase (adenine-specific)